MNVLMLSLMYPEDMKTQVARDARDKLQNQINSNPNWWELAEYQKKTGYYK